MYKVEPKKKKQIVPEQADEDDMYDEEPEEYVNAGAEIDENLKMFQRKGEKFIPKDTLFVFMGHEFLYLDYQKDTWAMSDVHYIAG